MDLFEGHALQSCLQIPPGLDLQQVRHAEEGAHLVPFHLYRW